MKSTAAFIFALLMTISLGAQSASQFVNLHHWTGQGVAPVYEGFDINPDGSLPARRGQPTGMTVLWAKYRGPGTVSFTDAQAKLADGRATTTAAFSEPGDYILQAVVDDGSGESAGNFGYHCCWTNTQAKLTIKGAQSTINTQHSTISQTPTFARDVAPIFQKNCQ